MTSVVRLETHAELEDDATDRFRLSVSLRHEAVLSDGRRLLLLDDRGWSSSISRSSPDGIWSMTSAEEIEKTARVAVGPDEPPAGRSHEDMAADHWAMLAETLGRQGVVIEPAVLRGSPHTVVLGEHLRSRLSGSGRRSGGR